MPLPGAAAYPVFVMLENCPANLTVVARRRARRLGYVQGMFWAVGSALASGSLLFYLGLELGARGTALSFVLAMPSLVGLLQLVSPAVVANLGGAKRACLLASEASYLVLLAGLPVLVIPGMFPRRGVMAGLVVLVCVHQLLEYVGTVALWSWFGDVVRRRARGRYFARRQMLQLACLIPALPAGGYAVDYLKAHFQTTRPELVPAAYAIVNGIGCLFLLGSLVPLVFMPAVAHPTPRRPADSWQVLLAPLVDGRYPRLLAFRSWFSFFNGITQTAQRIFAFQVLGFGAGPLQGMLGAMRLGQVGVSAWAGPFADRHGNRPVLILSQSLVSAALLFFLFASPEARWLLWGAWILWSAYAGLNICLPNLMLRLALREENTAHIAVLEALSGLAYGLSVIAGGALYDFAAELHISLNVGPMRFDHMALLFLFGFATRSIGVWWLARIDEPGAHTWREILAGYRPPQPAAESTRP